MQILSAYNMQTFTTKSKVSRKFVKFPIYIHIIKIISTYSIACIYHTTEGMAKQFNNKLKYGTSYFIILKTKLVNYMKQKLYKLHKPIIYVSKSFKR